jgi:predicted amino acid racemase
MALLKLHRQRLEQNYRYLRDLMAKEGLEWGVVTKLLCGNKMYLREVINLGAREIHDSRISNLKAIKEIDPEIQTVYIKPPAKRAVPYVIRYADVSFNTELVTIRSLSAEAQRQGRFHRILVMIELGDLREGVMGDQVLEFYGEVFGLPSIKIIGVGANLNCLNGVMPSQDKLMQLVLYEKLIEATFGHDIPWVSGGSTVTLPLVLRHQLPAGVNHFRLGEALFFGAVLFNHTTFDGMRDDVFELEAEILETQEKPRVPHGTLDQNPSGAVAVIDEADYGTFHHRAIIDVGLLECDPQYLLPVDDSVVVLGASSDMIVLDLGDNPHGYEVGGTVRFRLKYMGALGLMNSRYIDKQIAEDAPAKNTPSPF